MSTTLACWVRLMARFPLLEGFCQSAPTTPRATCNTINALGNKTTSVYDADNQLIETIAPLVHTTFAYAADGRLTATTDALGQRRDFTCSHVPGSNRRRGSMTSSRDHRNPKTDWHLTSIRRQPCCPATCSSVRNNKHIT